MKNFMRGIFSLAIAVLGIAALVLILNLDEKAVPHRNPVDQTLSLYSDKRIPQSAISTDLDFQKVAFLRPPLRESLQGEAFKKLPFSSQIASVVKSVQSLMAPAPAETETPKELGTWVWTPVLEMTPEYIDSLISGAESHGINAMYISIDSYLDIFTMAPGKERDDLEKKFSDILASFIMQARERGIAVDAEAGWRNWAEKDNDYKPFAIVSFVKNFNNSHSAKFRGFQYDVEPYLLDSYHENDKNKAAILKNFIKLVDDTENFLADSDLKFTVVVPDFYDGKDKATPSFSYNGRKDYAFGHILNILDRRPGNAVIVMSYRNFAQGEDGSIEVTNNEMMTARGRGYKTKIIIAQETGEFPPPYITFHATSKRYMLREISKLNGVFARHPNFGGLALHYANTLLELK